MNLLSARTYASLLAVPLLAFAISACDNSSTTPPDQVPENEALSGGETTVFDETSAAFGLPAENLTAEQADMHIQGDKAFEATFVSDTTIRGRLGLGPIYNNTSCRGCHILDGRGAPPNPGEPLKTMLLRVSIPGTDANGGPNDVPGFGGQFQPRAIRSAAPEGNVLITYEKTNGQFADGTPYELSKPIYQLTATYAPMPGNVMTSPRVAPLVFGLGLLEAVPEETVLSFADEADRNGDGISGKANYVYDAQTHNRSALGRFGAKANTPTLRQQTAGAYNQDMGITSSIFPVESSFGQPQYPGQHEIELDDKTLDAATFYVSTLAVPARRSINDAQVRHGQKIFADAKCAACHIPTMKTGPHPIAAVANQVIHPYTDLLVHDMGAELADNRPDYRADGNEWRTPALWGLGLTKITSGHTNLLHDGRARSIVEAIMWHGGEGEASREYVRKLPTADRADLLAFLNSL